MSLSPEDKEFIVRALAMHAVFTRSGGPGEQPLLKSAEAVASWIRGFSESDQQQTMAAPARLVAPAVIDSENLIYRIEADKTQAVFDGDVMLPPECYGIDADRGELKLKRVPAFGIRVLVGAGRG